MSPVSPCIARQGVYTRAVPGSGMVHTPSARRPQPAGAPLSERKPFDMAAHRREFGRVWGAEAKAASARLRKGRG
jgi:hypothetical protein